MHTDNSADIKESKESENLTNKLFVIVAVAIFFITIVLSSYFSNFNFQLSKDNADWGTFGDFIGGSLNPFLSFLSLIALLYTIKLQSNELAFSRKELELTRRELESSSEALKEQADTLAIQRFENTFFSLLKLHNEALEDIRAHRDNVYLGRSIIEQYLTENIELINVHRETNQNACLSYHVVKAHFLANSNNFEKYFQVLYHILNFVATHSGNDKHFSERFVGETDKKSSSPMEMMYSELVKSLIVSDLINIMALSCCEPKSNSVYFKLKPLIERYCLLDTLPNGFLGMDNKIIDEIRSSYAPNAFGKAAE